MSSFWSTFGYVIKSLFAGVGGTGRDDDDPFLENDTASRYGIARFAQKKSGDGDKAADMLRAALADVPETRAVAIDHFVSGTSDVHDPFQAMHDIQYGVLSSAHRHHAETVFWGRYDPQTGGLDLHMVSDQLASPLYELLLSLTYRFQSLEHKDTVDACRILLASELILQARGGERRSLQASRLSARLEDFHERILQGENFQSAGDGVATAYGMGAFMLSETGDRTYCATALKVLEPRIRAIINQLAGHSEPATNPEVEKTNPDGQSSKAGRPPEPFGQNAVARLAQSAKAGHTGTADLLSSVGDLSKLSGRDASLLALYGCLANWSMVGSLSDRSGKVAIQLWQMLERRLEFANAAPASRAYATCKLGEAMVLTAKDIDDADLSDRAGGHYRRAIGMINSKSHGPIYGMAAYGLAEAIVASANIKNGHIPDTQVVPVFQAAIKVSSRRAQPYLWGRTVFALATVQLTSGTSHEDTAALENARINFAQSYEAFMDAGAKGAARSASAGYSRTENVLSQLGHRKALMDATGGSGEKARQKVVAH